MQIKNRKEYEEGAIAWKEDKLHRDNPYEHGSDEWQAWVNGFGDAGDHFLRKELDKCNS